MSLWSRLTGRQERATYARTSGNMLLNDTPAIWWMGHDSGGGAYPIGPNGPHAVEVQPAVTRLTALITDPLAAVPWRTARQDVTGAATSSPRWITDPHLLRPDARFPLPVLPSAQRLPRSTFWSAWIRNAVWHGASHVLYVEDGAGQPIAGSLRLVSPWTIAPRRNQDGAIIWELDPDGAAPVQADRDGYLELDGPLRWRLLTLRDPHAPVDDDGRSVSVFDRHGATFGLSQSLDHYMRGVYRSGIPSGYLKVNSGGLTQETADELKRRWMDAHGGERRSVAVLNATTDYQPLTFSPVDAALVEAKRANLADLALAFGLDPAGALGVSLGNSATYSNVQQHFARLRTDLLPWIAAVEQTVGALLPAGQELRLDFTELTRPDPVEQYAGLETAVNAGFMTVDEARGVLGLPALAGPAGDSLEPADDARAVA